MQWTGAAGWDWLGVCAERLGMDRQEGNGTDRDGGVWNGRDRRRRERQERKGPLWNALDWNDVDLRGRRGWDGIGVGRIGKARKGTERQEGK